LKIAESDPYQTTLPRNLLRSTQHHNPLFITNVPVVVV
jgi:hypothetical protein